MNVFNPRSFSTDWEILVVDRLNRCIDSEKLMGFAGALRNELCLPITVDWNSLEFPMGINTSFAQFHERIIRVTDRAAQLLHEFQLDLYPSAGHPVEPMYSSSHIHVGTITDETMGIRLENQLLRYLPAFAALAANSAVAEGMHGEYKSYRVRYQARGCTRPGSVRQPEFAQCSWGTDACSKLYGVPTLEVRITDCASSRRFLAELGVFVAAFVHQQGTKVSEELPSELQYREFLINRWSAAKYGLQAVFRWDGQYRPVVDVLAEMLDDSTDAQQLLGMRPGDFTLINTMLEKRICQADWALSITRRYEDPYVLASVFGKLLQHWELFDEYVTKAPALDLADAPDDEAVLQIHREMFGEGTHFYRSRDAMNFSPPMADQMLAELESRGLIRRETTRERGIEISRIPQEQCAK
ncbi:MAG: glutamate-cysteine ligase family protein [bacterium]